MEIINLDKICGGCATAKIGTKLDILEKDLADSKSYSGELLTEEEINTLNNICPVLNRLSLGTYINGILEASKNGTEAEELTDEQIEILNNGICGGFSSVEIGTKLEEFVEEINGGEPPVPPVEVIPWTEETVSNIIVLDKNITAPENIWTLITTAAYYDFYTEAGHRNVGGSGYSYGDKEVYINLSLSSGEKDIEARYVSEDGINWTLQGTYDGGKPLDKERNIIELSEKIEMPANGSYEEDYEALVQFLKTVE